MRVNEGNTDRTIRVIFGLVLLSQAFAGLNTPLGYIGFIPLVTGIVGVCPIYKIFGINTCSANKTNHF